MGKWVISPWKKIYFLGLKPRLPDTKLSILWGGQGRSSIGIGWFLLYSQGYVWGICILPAGAPWLAASAPPPLLVQPNCTVLARSRYTHDKSMTSGGCRMNVRKWPGGRVGWGDHVLWEGGTRLGGRRQGFRESKIQTLKGARSGRQRWESCPVRIKRLKRMASFSVLPRLQWDKKLQLHWGRCRGSGERQKSSSPQPSKLTHRVVGSCSPPTPPSSTQVSMWGTWGVRGLTAPFSPCQRRTA